jgi:hypothetical protein
MPWKAEKEGQQRMRSKLFVKRMQKSRSYNMKQSGLEVSSISRSVAGLDRSLAPFLLCEQSHHALGSYVQAKNASVVHSKESHE